MKILAIDASSEACSAALLSGSNIIEQFKLAPRIHTKLILPMMEAVLAEAGCNLSSLDALAFGCGPGSFTGIRVAASVAQGVALGVDLPVIPVSTLAAIAQQGFRLHAIDQLAVATDARMSQVYWAEFKQSNGLMRATSKESVATPTAELLAGMQSTVFIGNGWQVYQAAFPAFPGQVITDCDYPQAQDICTLAADAYAQNSTDWPIDQAMPVYVRNQVVQAPS